MQTKSMTQLVQLAPTNVFYAFLLSQLGEKKQPNRELLDVDNSLYRIPYFESVDDTLNYLESYFEPMFSYEIKRWLGKDASHELTRNFDDFSLCFELKLHTHVYAIQPPNKCMMALGIKPNIALCDALNLLSDFKGKQLRLSDLEENHTLVLLGKSQLNQLERLIEINFEKLISLERKRLELFNYQDELSSKKQLFSFSIHQHVTDVMTGESDMSSFYKENSLLDLMFDKG